MSILLDKLEAFQCNRRVYEQEPLRCVEAKEHVINIVATDAWEYWIRVIIGFKGFVSQPGDLPNLKEQARKTIAMEIYGEFRPLIGEIHHALWQRDFRHAEAKLHELELRMFP